MNMYAPSLYQLARSPAISKLKESGIIFGSRDFNTVYEQTLVRILDGDLFEVPGVKWKAAVGVEYRNDDIQSNPDAVARDGCFGAFSLTRGIW